MRVINENPTCRQCGRKIDAPSCQRVGGECCCEGCFLEERQWQAEKSSDAGCRTLAEALRRHAVRSRGGRGLYRGGARAARDGGGEARSRVERRAATGFGWAA